MFDGLFGHQLLLLVPLHAAHHAGPDDVDHGLLRQAGPIHLLSGEDNNLNTRREKISHETTQPQVENKGTVPQGLEIIIEYLVCCLVSK